MANRYRGGGGMSLKPENALKRAEELIGVGQKQNALQTLHDTVTNKRQQRNWTKALEQVMLKHIDLGVDMRAGRRIKDALINYRNAVQALNVSSLETVVDHLLDSATQRAEGAQRAAAAALEQVPDLDSAGSPEELMLSYVSGEKMADRTDRALVTPWFKFLWETYRTVLDVLKNNSRLEGLYATAAARAANFCLVHKRATEFRRLCDMLRNHLSNLLRYRDQGGANRTDLAEPATWERYAGMRFEQLRTACALGLWAEAFRCVEDVQGLFAAAPRASHRARAALMSPFYAALTRIFARSESRLYNAYAWYRLFTFSRTQVKGLPAGDVATLASNVVLSALAIMPYEGDGRREGEGSVEAERALRMAGILGFTVVRRSDRPVLTRQALIADIERKGVLALTPAPVKAIWALLETDFDPLNICERVAPLLNQLEGVLPLPSPACPAPETDLSAYVPALQRLALARTVRQLSEVYSVVRVETVERLAPWSTPGAAERLVVEGVAAGYFSARFDHRARTVNFGAPDLGSDRLRACVSDAARRLARALAAAGASVPSRAAAPEAAALLERARAGAALENSRALSRKVIIEKRKEEAEQAAHEREREAASARAAAEAQARAAEAKRSAEERARRETERIQRELEDQEQRELKAYLVAQGKKVSDGARLDARAITAEAVSEQLKAQAELQKRLQKTARTLDHLERAAREAEAPLRARAAQRRAADGADAALARAAQAAEAARAAWERDLALKARLQRAREDCEELRCAVQARRSEEFAARRAASAESAERRRAARAAERDLARRREFVRRARLELEARRRAEEEEARELEVERARKEVEERRRKLDEAAERQRRREEEVEAKRRADAGAREGPGARGGERYVLPHLRSSGGGGAGGAGGGRPEWGRRDEGARREDVPRREEGVAAGAPPAREERPAGAWKPSRARESAPPPPRAGGDRW